jgi:hypothetical protein
MVAKKSTTPKKQTKAPAQQPTVEQEVAAAETPAEGAAAAPQIEVTGPRVFVIGPNKVVESDATVGLTNEQARSFLQGAYPEVANATIRERNDNGQAVVEFLPQPGRKG